MPAMITVRFVQTLGGLAFLGVLMLLATYHYVPGAGIVEYNYLPSCSSLNSVPC